MPTCSAPRDSKLPAEALTLKRKVKKAMASSWLILLIFMK